MQLGDKLISFLQSRGQMLVHRQRREHPTTSYGPDKRDITVLAIEPHPEDQKRGAYQRIKLSTLPPAKK
jgi:hypothetical protein